MESLEITQFNRTTGAPVVSRTGRKCFSSYYGEFTNLYGVQRSVKVDWGLLPLCREVYERFADSRQSDVGHYYRTMYNIVKFIATSEVENKQIYANILRAQLSSSELNLLFYNCLSKYGNEKFKPLIEKFGLLENMDFSRLIDPNHRELYKESAFNSPP